MASFIFLNAIFFQTNRYANQAVERHKKIRAKTQDITINKLKLIIWVQILYYSLFYYDLKTVKETQTPFQTFVCDIYICNGMIPLFLLIQFLIPIPNND